jgi:N6-L-threonylcarbamoyladenine synthase
MIVLGIETSCDETAAALVEETGDRGRPWRVRSSVVASQSAIHSEWGGVVPELSARQHIRDICGVVQRALAEAGVTRYDGVAVTQGPGLVGSLLVGVSFAKALAWSRDVPLIPVHHLAGHIESLVIEHGEMPTPAVVLVASGGHTSLYLVPSTGARADGINGTRSSNDSPPTEISWADQGEARSWIHQDLPLVLLGRTRDDAAGEAYDKVAKLLGLGYPGGPVIDRLAAAGDDLAVPFPKPRLTHADRNAPDVPGRRDFSFSGLKTSVLRYVMGRRAALGLAEGNPLPGAEIRDICASFQRVVVGVLLDRLFEAARWYGARSVGIAGGVSANSRLRAEAEARGQARDLPVFIPGLALATDNAAMIAAAGLRRYQAGAIARWDLEADAAMKL